jgi:hypothetical protein
MNRLKKLQKLEPVKITVEVKLGGRWVEIDEPLSFSQHVQQARILGATEIRTLDGSISQFVK